MWAVALGIEMPHGQQQSLIVLYFFWLHTKPGTSKAGDVIAPFGP